jgi:hypothetical protein
MNGSVSRHRIALIAALASLGLAWTSSAARAEDAAFRATVKFELVSWQGTHYSFDGAGHARSYGSFDAEVESQANNGNGDETSVATLDFGWGDTLTISSEDAWVPDPKKPAGGYRAGTYVITGGTGRFAGASGTGTFTGVPNGDGTGVIDYDGTISW